MMFSGAVEPARFGCVRVPVGEAGDHGPGGRTVVHTVTESLAALSPTDQVRVFPSDPRKDV